MMQTHLLCLLAAACLLGCDHVEPLRSAPDDTEHADDDEPTDTSAADAEPDADVLDVRFCHPSNAAAPAPVPSEVGIGTWTVRADAASGAWSVTPAGASAPVLEGPGTCVTGADGQGLPAVRLGDATPGLENLFGAFRIRFAGGTLPAVTGAPPQLEPGDASLAMHWPVTGADGLAGTATLRFALEPTSGGLAISLESSEPSWQTGELNLRCRSDEAFFGLGTQAFAMNLRGATVPLWTQEQGIGKPADGGLFPLNNIPEGAYAPMGVWHSSAGYSAVVAHDALSLIDLCEQHDDRLALRSYPELPAFVLLPGDTPRARLAALTEHFVGRLDALPRWVLAPWNDAVGGPQRLVEVATTLREADIASSAIWTEDWAGVQPGGTGYRLSYAWAWDPEFYPDLPGDIAALHAQGFAFLAYFNPFVVSTTPMFAEGQAGGFLIERADGSTYTFLDPGARDASLVDLTNPDAVAWLQGYLHTAAVDLGIDGWMADFAEWLPVDAVLHSGEDAWRVHNRYPLMWQAANRAALQAAHADAPDGADNWTFFARSGWASTQGGTAGLAPTLWAGDQNTDWAYDDGFPTVLPIGAHAGLAGVAVYGHDIAGYTAELSPPTTKELFLRWSALGALTPLMRTHHGSEECANWSFDRDAETLAHYRRYAAIHTLLMPLLTTLVFEARSSGLPLWRHPWLVEPHRSGLWSLERDYQVFLGDDLLVAPVLAEGATTRTVHLPEAGWWPLFGNAPLAGEVAREGDVVELVVDAAPTELPVFVRPGRALVLLAEPVDSFYGASEPGITDYDDAVGHYRVALYPAADGHVADTTALDLDERVLASVVGSGWSASSLAQPPSVGDGPLPDCATAADGADCYDAASATARLHGTDATLIAADGATLRVSAPGTAATFVVGVGAAAWGEWAAPTALTDLDPEVASPCPDSSEP